MEVEVAQDRSGVGRVEHVSGKDEWLAEKKDTEANKEAEEGAKSGERYREAGVKELAAGQGEPCAKKGSDGGHNQPQKTKTPKIIIMSLKIGCALQKLES